ncbi:hypothetical protein [Methylobacterium gregans]|uniref:hypothetical protein n=1 Tax=Methylobacterium gregans TaxID=374424 RepID=UPI003610D830
MRLLLLLFAAAAILYAVGVGALALVQRRLIYPGAYADAAPRASERYRREPLPSAPRPRMGSGSTPFGGHRARAAAWW